MSLNLKKLIKPYLIAEIGINHNGDLQIAKKLIDAAFCCNWDCVKFQKRTPDLCVPDDQKNVLRETPWGKITYLEYKEKIEFGKKEYDYINKYCNEKPIDWTSSIWDLPSLDFLLNYNVPFIKIPSAIIMNHELISKAAKSGIPVILSTGMSNLDEIDTAVEILEKYSTSYALMHTNSSYPTPKEEINLHVIKVLKERYNCVIGYSGHEYGLEPTTYAAALGAKIIERHVTLSHDMWGSDHFASLEVMGMDMMAKRIKDINIILGKKEKNITKSEIPVRKKLRGC